ncbi:hypothetical protein NE237_000892 [Protea cynaroides]|uniref:Syntaxin N-terminal domain-containing protein n=1 Tax=Protea cynaroides TaxID=273540 RepID=A0A9Q0KT47_9MAGN|nr:hypothetical protein NE237_000892 [Protea cynaroides]
MNDPLRNSFSGIKGRTDSSTFVDVEMSSAANGGINLNKFFEGVEGIKDELKEMERLQQRLQQSNEESKTIHNAKAMKNLRSSMDSDVATALKKAKLINVRLEALDRANAANRWELPPRSRLLFLLSLS